MPAEKSTRPRRRSGRLIVLCLPSTGYHVFWTARLHHLSGRAAGVVFDYPLETGTRLALELGGPEEPRAAEARVVHATPHQGAWLLECELAEELSREEVELLGKAGE